MDLCESALLDATCSLEANGLAEIVFMLMRSGVNDFSFGEDALELKNVDEVPGQNQKVVWLRGSHIFMF